VTFYRHLFPAPHTVRCCGDPPAHSTHTLKRHATLRCCATLFTPHGSAYYRTPPRPLPRLITYPTTAAQHISRGYRLPTGRHTAYCVAAYDACPDVPHGTYTNIARAVTCSYLRDVLLRLIHGWTPHCRVWVGHHTACNTQTFLTRAVGPTLPVQVPVRPC